MSKSAISDEMRVDMVKLFYANGSSWTAARRALTKKYGNEGRKIHLRTIQRQVTKFERELTLRRKTTGGGAKTAVTEKNIKKVEKILDQSPRRSVRNIAKRTKLSKTAVWRILTKELGKYPYRIQMLQEQTAANKQERVDFAKQFAGKIESDKNFLKNLIVSDEAHFQLSGWINTQNARIWSEKQPYATLDSPKTIEKVAVWTGLMSVIMGVSGPTFSRMR